MCFLTRSMLVIVLNAVMHCFFDIRLCSLSICSVSLTNALKIIQFAKYACLSHRMCCACQIYKGWRIHMDNNSVTEQILSEHSLTLFSYR